MAEIVLGIGSSHAPQLEMPPQNWRTYAEQGKRMPNHWYEGKTYSYDELLETMPGYAAMIHAYERTAG